jgi:hypothetical protein
MTRSRAQYRTASYIALALILVAALVLRTYRLSNPLVYSDEAFSWRVASYPLPQLVHSVAGDTAPLGHFLILKAWLETVGTSPAQMRSLSVIFGLGTVLMVYLLCKDALRLRLTSLGRDGNKCPLAAYLGPLFAATLVAIHASQISASRITRMYSQGCFLAAASSWCVLKALFSPNRQAAWWTAYALLAAAALHTHNFALFMVAAQFLYVVLVLIFPSKLRMDRRNTLRLAAIAFCLISLLYAPWLPVFLQQAARVQQNFWLPDITKDLLAETFITWLTGLRGGHLSWLAAIWIAFFVAMTTYTISQRDELGVFFLVQALLPWIATLLIAILSARPLLDERYLVFSQIALLTYWAYMCTHLSVITPALLVGLNLLICTAAGTFDQVSSVPLHPPSIPRAIEFMRTAHQPDDVIITREPRDLNIFKYYASQAAFDDFRIYCRCADTPPGHVNHISSLAPNDRLPKGQPPQRFRRIWTIRYAASDWEGEWIEVWNKLYEPMDQTWASGLRIRRYEQRRP